MIQIAGLEDQSVVRSAQDKKNTKSSPKKKDKPNKNVFYQGISHHQYPTRSKGPSRNPDSGNECK
jgi:hypothetical protein